MIAPVEHEHQSEPQVEPFNQFVEQLEGDDESTPQQVLNWARQLIGDHPVASMIAGLTVGIAAGWIMKRGRS